LIRSPSRPRNAGSSVIEPAIAAIVTRMAPPARLRKIDTGTISIPSSASTTVRPLKNTARLAVAPERRIASSFSNPFFRSSRYRDTMNSE
jgi:hypothetical protein